MTTNPAQAGSSGKGKAFFDRADQVSETGNWDFAIELYLQGLHREPENLDRGHKPLRDVGIKRKGKGGKPAGMIEQIKLKGGKTPIDLLVNGSHLLAKDPTSLPAMEQVLTAAKQLELKTVIHWIASILVDTLKATNKPSRKTIETVISACASIEQYALATAAADIGVRTFPNDFDMADLQRDMSAKYTLHKGKFGQEGSFMKGVKDIEKQKELVEQDSLKQSDSFIDKQIAKAREEYLASPTVPGKILGLVDAMLKKNDDGSENEAIDILTKAFKDTNTYQFKMRIGEIKIRQMTRRYTKLFESGDKAAAEDQLKKLKAFELDEYAERAMNYPTDMSLKFELGKRLLEAGRLDDAIGPLQQATRDPRKQLAAAVLLGQAFEKKGWLREASETFERALQSADTEEKAKALRYSLGSIMEKMGKLEDAQKQFSLVAQIDFNYMDVRKRLDEVRAKREKG